LDVKLPKSAEGEEAALPNLASDSDKESAVTAETIAGNGSAKTTKSTRKTATAGAGRTSRKKS
jgi:hypothetical protein